MGTYSLEEIIKELGGMIALLTKLDDQKVEEGTLNNIADHLESIKFSCVAHLETINSCLKRLTDVVQ